MEQVVEVPPVPPAQPPTEPPTEPPTPQALSKGRRSWLIVAVVTVVAGGIAIAVWPRPPAPPDARAIGLPVVRGDDLYQPDGTKLTLELSDFGYRLSQFAEVPAGIVVGKDRVDGTGENVVELQHPGGGATEFAHGYNTPFYVSLDGRTLIVDESDGAHGFDLDTGRELHHTTFGRVGHAAGDWAILVKDSLGSDVPYQLWNARTGAEIPFVPTDRALDVAGVGPDGSVLEIVYSGSTVDRDHDVQVCINVVTPAATVSTTYDGYCAKFLGIELDESPDGLWATFSDSGNATAGAVRIADIRASRWAPVPADPDQGIGSRWASAQSFLSSDGHTRCTVYGHCTDLHLDMYDVVGTLNGV